MSCVSLLVALLVGGHDLLELVNVGTGEVGNLSLVLDKDEGRHGGDVVLRGYVLAIVNIDLEQKLNRKRNVP